MAKRYKSANELNKMIERIENIVVGVDEITREPITMKPVTQKSISQKYSVIINTKGRIKSYEQTVRDLKTKGQKITYQDYINVLHELQDDEQIGGQLTPTGAMRYAKQDIIDKLFYGQEIEEYETGDGLKLTVNMIERMSASSLYSLITRVGNMSNDMKKEISNYDSNTFYDLLVQEYYEMMK